MEKLCLKRKKKKEQYASFEAEVLLSLSMHGSEFLQ